MRWVVGDRAITGFAAPASQMGAKPGGSASGAVNRRLQSPLVRRDGDLPLLKPFTGVIVASKPPGIWRVSVETIEEMQSVLDQYLVEYNTK